MYHVPLTQVVQSASSTFSRLLANFRGRAFLTTSHGAKKRSSASVRGVCCLGLPTNLADASGTGTVGCCHHACGAEPSVATGLGSEKVREVSAVPAAVLLLSCTSLPVSLHVMETLIRW